MGHLDNDGLIYLWSKIKALFNKGITGLSVSGKVITFTKGDGTTGTITTQDTNTTYGVVSKTANGLAPKLPDETTTMKYLRQDGTWAVPPDTNTTYSDMKGATSSAAGTHGLVPAPAAGNQAKYLRGDGTWNIPTNTTYSDFSGATASAAGSHGLVPAPPKIDDPGVRFLSQDGTWSPLQPSFKIESGYLLMKVASNAGAVWNFTPVVPVASSSNTGLMSSDDKSKLDALPTNQTLQSTYAKKSDITNVYRYKGSVADASKLPTSGQSVGDTYNIEAASTYGGSGMNVSWNGSAWDPLGEIFTITSITNAEIDSICV